VGSTLAWLASVREGIVLLTGEFLPEFLLVSFLLVVSWLLRKRFGRHAGSTF
jgi:hypothetical protein